MKYIITILMVWFIGKTILTLWYMFDMLHNWEEV